MKRSLLLALVPILIVGSCDTHAPKSHGSSESSDYARAICRYLARCLPSALQAFSEAKTSACEAYYSCGASGLGALAGEAVADEVGCAPQIEEAACGQLTLGSSGLAPRLIASDGSACGRPQASARGPHARAGERCVTEEGACAEGLFCQLDQPLKAVAGNLCGICAESAAPGEPCPLGTNCRDDAFCEDDKCVARKSEGSACTSWEQCLDGACLSGSCAPNPFLRLVADGRARGKECDPRMPDACSGDITLTCSDGRCRPKPDVGEPCQGITSCRSGLFCDKGRCLAQPRCTAKVGARCGRDAGYKCFGDTYCTGTDVNDLHCTPRIIGQAAGEVCNLACEGGLLCKDGSCVAPSELEYGSSCDSSSDCNAGACDRDIAPYCALAGAGHFCQVPLCDRCGTCVPKKAAAACDED